MYGSTTSSTRPYKPTRTDIKNLLMGRIDDAVHVTISRPIANIPVNRINDIHCEVIASKAIEYINFRVLGSKDQDKFIRGVVVQERCKESFFPHFHIQLICPDGMPMETFLRRLERAACRLCDRRFTFDLESSPVAYSLRPKYESCSGPGFVHVSNCHDGIPSYLTKDWEQGEFRASKVAILNGRSINMHSDRVDLDDHKNYEERLKRENLPYINKNSNRTRSGVEKSVRTAAYDVQQTL